jgi:hypothetical protein
LKYTITYKTDFGSVSAESENPEELQRAFPNLRSIANNLENSRSDVFLTSKRNQNQRRSRVNNEKRISRSIARSGEGETTKILREIQSKVLETNFFGKPRTTGETKQKLESTSGKRFASRKVSQALGILWKKRILNRTGTRNYYTYSK